jgi:hypothetical protein
MTALTVMAFGAGWLAKTNAQQKAPAPLITYFSHEKVDASFAQALASTGSKDLFTRKDRQGRTWLLTPTAAVKPMKASCIPMMIGRAWWSS